jgi:hypothetical protein
VAKGYPTNQEVEMKVSEALSRGLIQPDKVSDIELDPSRLIITQEFERKDLNCPSDYRERSLDALLKAGIRWHTDGNILVNATRRFVVVHCPYCHREMDGDTASGNMDTMNVHFKCLCGAEAPLEMASISVSPPRAKDD